MSIDPTQTYLGADEYYIAFDINQQAGTVRGIKVTLEYVAVTDLTKLLHIDLVNHPLYAELEAYILMNRKG